MVSESPSTRTVIRTNESVGPRPWVPRCGWRRIEEWFRLCAHWGVADGEYGGSLLFMQQLITGRRFPSRSCRGRPSSTMRQRIRRRSGRPGAPPCCSSPASGRPGTRSGVTFLGSRLCFWALVALIVFGIVMIFVRIPNGSLIYSFLGLLIFAGLTMFDFQQLRRPKNLDSEPLRRNHGAPWPTSVMPHSLRGCLADTAGFRVVLSQRQWNREGTCRESCEAGGRVCRQPLPSASPARPARLSIGEGDCSV
jgi:Inhibitor of apoptosis-promoting Bax1